MSELRKTRPDRLVTAWFDRVPNEALHLSALTIGEIAKGVETLSRRDQVAAQRLESWLEDIRRSYADRVIAVDAMVAERWGRLAAHRARPIIDTLLAATALVHGMTLVTRNLRDVADTGVVLLNPWEPP